MNLYERLQGALTALVTPFDDKGEVDEACLTRLVKAQIEHGIDGLVPCGTTGETPTLSGAEQERVVRTTIEAAAGRVPVIAGTGSTFGCRLQSRCGPYLYLKYVGLVIGAQPTGGKTSQFFDCINRKRQCCAQIGLAHDTATHNCLNGTGQHNG